MSYIQPQHKIFINIGLVQYFHIGLKNLSLSMFVSLHFRADLSNLAYWSQEWYSEHSKEAQACKLYMVTLYGIVGKDRCRL